MTSKAQLLSTATPPQQSQWLTTFHQATLTTTATCTIRLSTEFSIAGSASKLRAKSVLTRDTIRCSTTLNRATQETPSAASQIAQMDTASLETNMTTMVRSTRSPLHAVRNLLALAANSQIS